MGRNRRIRQMVPGQITAITNNTNTNNANNTLVATQETARQVNYDAISNNTPYDNATALDQRLDALDR